MFVQHILVFIERLKSSGKLIACDAEYLKKFTNRFISRNPEDKLNRDDLQFILQCFRSRWFNVMDDPENDYTLNSGGANPYWIQLARDIESFAKINHIQIVLPTVTNTMDFNNCTPLTETTHFENFFLSSNRKILYRKRGLCEHLLDNGFILSTCRNLYTKKEVSSLTVDELTRLQSCEQANGQFTIEDDQFYNFWDFLRRKVFSCLQLRGEMPVEVLPLFLRLIETYFHLKTAGADFNEFKNAKKSFFNALSKTNLNNLNYFYGTRITYKGEQMYLLDFLIAINKADFYTLDDQFIVLARMLYHFNPVLKASCRELRPIYSDISELSIDSSSKVPEYESRKRDCFKFLVSFFTANFELFPFTGQSIELWDRQNTVFSEAANIFKLFLPDLLTNNMERVLLTYNKVKSGALLSQRDSGMFSWLGQLNETKDWFSAVQKGDFSRFNAYWFEPELLLHVLVRFRANNSSYRELINKFLDELIHTYAQNNNDLLKELRINIFFSRFIQLLPPQDRRSLIILLQLYDLPLAKSSFLNNCIYYIGSRLAEHSAIRIPGPASFFGSIRKVDESRLKISYSGINGLSAIIDSFKESLHSHELKITESVLDTMWNYLRNLTRPILSIVEVDEARSSVQQLDSLAAPT